MCHRLDDEKVRSQVGYLLNSLSNLPVDDEVNFYIFVINGQWDEPLYGMMEKNFATVAKNIGNSAVIARGLDPAAFVAEVQDKYVGHDQDDLWGLLPALLITDRHPDRLDDKAMRLVIPLREADTRCGGWPNFFRLLSDFVQFRSDEFLQHFQKKEDVIGDLNRFIEIKAEFFGIALNVNEIFAWWRERAARQTG